MANKRTAIKQAALTFGLLAALALAPDCKADSVSYTGTLASSSDVFETTLTLATASNVTVQTWGFGGGINAAGKVIPAGGFDPFFAIFSGTGSGASMVTDGMGNPFGTSDVLTNFSSFMGCPPAGTVNIGGATCGDITMNLELATGTYTLLLSDGAYLPNAIFDNGTLSEAFTDLTGGAFQTCNGATCVNDTGNWAFDVTTSHKIVNTPEPGSLLLLGTGLFALASRLRRNRTTSARSVENNELAAASYELRQYGYFKSGDK